MAPEPGFYDEFYTRVATSRAHALFCERVYGRDLAQHGMLDQLQLDYLLTRLRLTATSEVLELGCGNGRLAEHVSDLTLARITGVDLSAVGIRQAVERTADRRERLRFVRADMAALDFAPGAFDVVLAVDSLYFVSDLAALVDRLRPLARAGGRLAAFWSAWVAPDEPRAALRADRTRLGQALAERAVEFEAIDFGAAEAEHWRRKLAVARELESAFAAEGNEFLYQNRSTEAECHRPYVAAGSLSRYLYLASL